ncbi:hypothetical protein F3Y22_tig00015498pilonHSYRG00027 [Hibiscus syriacus]|uniref:Uncharacterized protein n=1 Tax=Hibiscus syriacus TaxID=106335 RepID=A0A6A3BY65_HIBSY|nr:hypothetical protein F3Y22_tig00015498pilonHSYRG00027 [Hibiscus syriacus]
MVGSFLAYIPKSPQLLQIYTSPPDVLLYSPNPKSTSPKYPSPSRFIFFAQNGNNDDDLTKQPNKKPEEQASDGGDSKDDRRSIFNFRLGDLLDPDPDNIVALVLTGLLSWASVQVLWQLFLISGAILLAALKYSFIAALLVFVLITLL